MDKNFILALSANVLIKGIFICGAVALNDRPILCCLTLIAAVFAGIDYNGRSRN